MNIDVNKTKYFKNIDLIPDSRIAVRENEKLLPIQNYEQHDGNPFHIQTKSHDDEILDQTKCNFYSILSSNQNTTEVLFDTNHDGNEEFRNRVNNFVDEKTSPYSN